MHKTAIGFILDAEVNDAVVITYNSPQTEQEQTAKGIVTSADCGLWVRFETENSYQYQVCGDMLSNREKGEVVRDNRKVGMLTDYEVIDK